MWNAMACRVAVAAVVVSLSGGAAAAAQVQLYVSTDGDDAWSGKLAEPNEDKTDGPFATLIRARDEIRSLKQRDGLWGGASVIARGGVYTLGHPFELSAKDSGTAEAPMVYAAAAGEQVRLVGGNVVTGFGPVTDKEILARLDDAA